MKILVAHMLLNYDIEDLAKRPKPVAIMWLNLPAVNATVRVRRRVLKLASATARSQAEGGPA